MRCLFSMKYFLMQHNFLISGDNYTQNVLLQVCIECFYFTYFLHNMRQTSILILKQVKNLFFKIGFKEINIKHIGDWREFKHLINVKKVYVCFAAVFFFCFRIINISKNFEDINFCGTYLKYKQRISCFTKFYRLYNTKFKNKHLGFILRYK